MMNTTKAQRETVERMRRVADRARTAVLAAAAAIEELQSVCVAHRKVRPPDTFQLEDTLYALKVEALPRIDYWRDYLERMEA